MTSRDQLKRCQNSWSAFTTRENREWYLKGLRRGAEICRSRLEWLKVNSREAMEVADAAEAIEREIPPTPTEPVVREG